MTEDFGVRLFRRGDSLTVHVAGELDIVTASQLDQHAAAVADAAHVHVDLSGVSFLDVKGASALEGLLVAARDRGASVALVGASDAQIRLLSLMGLAEFAR